ncbi:cytochrome P450, partial [Hysterangium stoloniferum]
GLTLPPGSHGDFLMGNFRDMPSHHEWETYSEWQKKYRDLIYLNVLGTSLLYVNSAKMAYELFDKRWAIYSDRPILPMVGLYVLLFYTIGMMPYGERWRQHCHAFHQNFSTTVLAQHSPVQIKHSR